jgi:hypothetical protein
MIAATYMRYFLFAALLLVYCNVSSQSQQGDTTRGAAKMHGRKAIPNSKNYASAQNKTEQQLLDRIEKLPEVKAIGVYIDSITSHKKGVAMVSARPNETNPFYSVHVGYNGPDRFIVFYNFCMDEKDREIKYYDPIDSKIITLQEWRKNKKSTR